jgi:hypothetical protein
MSACGKNLAIISIGVSCQSSMQIRINAPAISKLTGEEVSKSSFPFDWLIMPPFSFCRIAENGAVFPKSFDDVDTASKIKPSWNGAYFWHEDINSDNFDNLKEKYNYISLKLFTHRRRRVFVISNTQNNLDYVSAETDIDFTLGRAQIIAVQRSLDNLFRIGTNELIVVTSEDRVADDPADWPAHHYLVDRSTRESDDWVGDVTQWDRIFSEYFTSFPTTSL